MQIRFTPEQLSRPGYADSAVEINACIQCGYCIEICPTHQLLADELDSPKGRVRLIREMLEHEGSPDDDTVRHIDRCLHCLACMSACPSSVNYMHLADHARRHIEDQYRRPLGDRLLRWMLARVLPYPRRFRLVLRGARMMRPLASVLPNRWRGMLDLAPARLPPASRNDLPQVFPAAGEHRKRVALLTGCAQRALNTGINDATIRILQRHGCEVVVAQGAGCCGALTHHMGRTTDSLAAAGANIQAWMKEVNGAGLDAVVVNASGCGTVVKDYGHMFRNHALAEDAATISGLARDISEVLSELDLDYQIQPGLKLAYHATCSLQYGQRIRFLPKKLLKAAGFRIIESRDAHTCCGSAGTYSLLQPQISRQLRDRKVQALQQGAPQLIAAGNIGCMVQIASGSALPVVHTVELLDWVTGGPVPPALEMNGMAI
ncbi:MAG: glycolate oxidase subunit GlcF [Gammaproteobacteria bacterium]|nr:glycolate oxidase subunit GlcF [Gammaproteobacteria bacterium]